MSTTRTTQDWSRSPPFQAHLSVATVEMADGRSLLRYDFRPEHGNRKGDVHGGILATLIDLAASQAIRSLAPDIAGLSTVSMTVNYLEPAQGSLVARGKIIKLGRTIAVAEATCETEDGAVAVHATATFRVIRHRGA